MDRREAYAIRGPRQPGKTTLLKLLAERLQARGRVIFLNFGDPDVLEVFERNPKDYISSFISGGATTLLFARRVSLRPGAGQVPEAPLRFVRARQVYRHPVALRWKLTGARGALLGGPSVLLRASPLQLLRVPTRAFRAPAPDARALWRACTALPGRRGMFTSPPEMPSCASLTSSSRST